MAAVVAVAKNLSVSNKCIILSLLSTAGSCSGASFTVNGLVFTSPYIRTCMYIHTYKDTYRYICTVDKHTYTYGYIKRREVASYIAIYILLNQVEFGLC